MKKFDKRELEATGFFPTVGEYYGYGPDWVVLGPKYQFPVTPKENFMLFMNRKEFYWVPLSARSTVPWGKTLKAPWTLTEWGMKLPARFVPESYSE